MKEVYIYTLVFPTLSVENDALHIEDIAYPMLNRTPQEYQDYLYNVFKDYVLTGQYGFVSIRTDEYMRSISFASTQELRVAETFTDAKATIYKSKEILLTK